MQVFHKNKHKLIACIVTESLLYSCYKRCLRSTMLYSSRRSVVFVLQTLLEIDQAVISSEVFSILATLAA